MEQEYEAGKYSVEESNIRQFRLVRAGKAAIDDLVLREAAVRPGFTEFAAYCGEHGIRLAVVSSGLDLYILPTLRRLGLAGLEVHCGRTRVTPGGVEVAYPSPSGERLLGGFKASHIIRFKGEGHTVVYIGDGLSDIEPASRADFVIARAVLAEHRRERGLPWLDFADFHDVREHVGGILGRARPAAAG